MLSHSPLPDCAGNIDSLRGPQRIRDLCAGKSIRVLPSRQAALRAGLHLDALDTVSLLFQPWSGVQCRARDGGVLTVVCVVEHLAGIGAALPTFLDSSDAVDMRASAQLASLVAADGAEILLVAGTTGRGAGLSHRQRCDLVRSCSTAGLPVICGVPENVSLDELRSLHAAGASGVLVAFAPEAGLARVGALRVFSEDVRLQLIGYHHPSHHDPLPREWFGQLAAWGIAVKNSDADPEAFQEMLDRDLDVFVGSTALLSRVQLGARGVLSGLGAIAMPDVKAAAHGDVVALERLRALEDELRGDRVGHVEQRARTRVAN